jgi:hypothetical protein
MFTTVLFGYVDLIRGNLTGELLACWRVRARRISAVVFDLQRARSRAADDRLHMLITLDPIRRNKAILAHTSGRLSRNCCLCHVQTG